MYVCPCACVRCASSIPVYDYDSQTYSYFLVEWLTYSWSVDLGRTVQIVAPLVNVTQNLTLAAQCTSDNYTTLLQSKYLPPLANYTTLVNGTDFCLILKPNTTLASVSPSGLFNAVLTPVDSECPALGYGVRPAVGDGGHPAVGYSVRPKVPVQC
jgi:hypothetical protein